MAAKRPGDIRLKRAYEPAAAADGTRILVDRLWPRGVSKDVLAIARWMKEIGPSDELRRWFGHDPERWEEFRRRYTAELSKQTALLAELRGLARRGRLTLVYAARDDAHNDAVVLRGVLTRARPARKSAARKRNRVNAKSAKSR